MVFPFDDLIRQAQDDRAKCEEALGFLETAEESCEDLTSQATALQSGVNQCFSVSGGDGSSFTASLSGYLGTAKSTLAATISTIDANIEDLETRNEVAILMAENDAKLISPESTTK